MDISIHTTAVFMLPLRKIHIDVLLRLSEHHYDGSCKAASKDSGFLRDWEKQIGWWDIYEQDEEYKVVRVDMHELGLCCKMLELSSALFHDKNSEEMKVARDMGNSFSGAFSLANTKYSEWQVKYTSKRG